MAKEGKAAQWDGTKIDAFQQMVQGCLDYAHQNSVSLAIVEATFRDALGSIEARRLVQHMRAVGAKL